MMTAEEIRAQQFAKGIRGYDTNEVDAFLASMADAWQRQQEASRRHKEELEALRGKVSRHTALADEVATVLQQAKATAKEILAHAEAEAKLIRETAEHDRQRLALKHGEALAQLKAYLAAQLERVEDFEKTALQSASVAQANGQTRLVH